MIDIPALAAAEVRDPEGASRPLGHAWRQRPAVLVFIRHFG